jgi:hypothetical protein
MIRGAHDHGAVGSIAMLAIASKPVDSHYLIFGDSGRAETHVVRSESTPRTRSDLHWSGTQSRSGVRGDYSW